MTKNKKYLAVTIALVSAFIISLSSVFIALSLKNRAFASGTFGDGTFTYSGENISGLNVYNGCNLEVLTEEEAAAAGVPAGYSGSIIKASGKSGGTFDISFDFTKSNVARKRITEVSFRVYLTSTSSDNASYPEFRIPEPHNGDKWFLRNAFGTSKTEQWTTITLSESEIDKLCVNGYLKDFVVGIRTNGATVMYLDEVTVNFIAEDKTPPVIYSPFDVYRAVAGAYPENIAIVTDDSGTCEVKYEWSQSSLDMSGRLLPGIHTCKITAIDTWDNVSTRTVTFIVEGEAHKQTCKVTFRAAGMEDIVIRYSPEEAAEIAARLVLPEPPRKDYYVGAWNFTLDKTANQVVEAVYTPKEYKVTFVADGIVVAVKTYSIESTSIIAPVVPVKAGYTGKWEAHSLNFTDVTVNAVYAKI